jgi:hypothetical protein
MHSTLVVTMGGKGGVGKTLALTGLADYLLGKGQKFSVVDCDTENAGQPTCLNHWVDGKATTFNLRHPPDRDRLFKEAASSGIPFTLVDLPGNSSGDISGWLQNVATLDVIEEAGLNMVAVGVVTPESGSAASVVKWVATLGDRASYLVVLNRKIQEIVPQPLHSAFSEWFDVAVPMLVPKVVPKERIFTVEMPNFEEHAMEELRKLGKLPGKALKDPSLHLLIKKRVRVWREQLYPQFDATGLFVPVNAETLTPEK